METMMIEKTNCFFNKKIDNRLVSEWLKYIASHCITRHIANKKITEEKRPLTDRRKN